jgi:group I intron endonuclease
VYPQSTRQDSTPWRVLFFSNRGVHVENTGICIIYALHHPNSSRVYVGKSKNGMRRPKEHSQVSTMQRYIQTPLTKWIKSLQKRGLEPKITVLEECAKPEDLNEAEIFHIAYFRSLGMQLLNLTDGGDGGFGYQPTEEARKKMSAINKKRSSTPAGRERMSKIANEYWSNPEAREKQREERLGKKWNEETRAKISAAHKGKQKSEQHKENLSIAASSAMRLRWEDPEYRKQQREAAIQRARDPEYRKKISEATKRALAKRRGEDVT